MISQQVCRSFAFLGSGGFGKLAVALRSHLFKHRVRRNDESDRCGGEKDDQVYRPETGNRAKPAEIRKHH